MRLLGDCNKQIHEEVQVILGEGDQIMRIVTTIILNTKRNK